MTPYVFASNLPKVTACCGGSLWPTLGYFRVTWSYRWFHPNQGYGPYSSWRLLMNMDHGGKHWKPFSRLGSLFSYAWYRNHCYHFSFGPVTFSYVRELGCVTGPVGPVWPRNARKREVQ